MGVVNTWFRRQAENLGLVKAIAAPIANPTGGSTTDAEARAAIIAILGVLRTNGVISP